jgi:starch synthase
MGADPAMIIAKAGGMADVVAGIVTALFDLGADIHVAVPNYRRLFNVDVSRLAAHTLREYRRKLPDRRIHLAEDSIFYYKSAVYHGDIAKTALRFQREVINHILRDVEPDILHCNDWMTGLIPSMARRIEVRTIFTMHNVHSHRATLDEIEDSGIATHDFWSHLYYSQMPRDYEEARATNPVDLLTSAIFASQWVNTVSPTFLEEIVRGEHEFVPPSVRDEIRFKHSAGRAAGVLNSPPAHYRPAIDQALVAQYCPDDHRPGKAANKAAFQRRIGLPEVPGAPLFFWPSRLDPYQKGCDLLAAILPRLVHDYRGAGIQIAFVADGPYLEVLSRLVARERLQAHVALAPFEERFSRLGFAGSDFTLMPSRFEPCGLPQMIGAIYGSLPLVHKTGGLQDTVSHVTAGTGNGFVFDHHDARGLRWAFDQALLFFERPPEERGAQIARIMREAVARFNHEETARAYLDLYERTLERPILTAAPVIPARRMSTIRTGSPPLP